MEVIKSDFTVYRTVNGCEEIEGNYVKFDNALSKAINLQLTECYDKIVIKKYSWKEENEVLIDKVETKIVYEANIYS